MLGNGRAALALSDLGGGGARPCRRAWLRVGEVGWLGLRARVALLPCNCVPVRFVT